MIQAKVLGALASVVSNTYVCIYVHVIAPINIHVMHVCVFVYVCIYIYTLLLESFLELVLNICLFLGALLLIFILDLL